MESKAVTPAKGPAIHEVSLDALFSKMSEWSTRIARRAYDFFAASGFTNGHDLDDWLKAEGELLQPVRLDVKDAKDEFIVIADVPGFDAKELDIHVNGSHLVIEGKHERTQQTKEKEGKTVSESESRQIYRALDLPAPILADKAHAELKNGVLELKLPKAAKPKHITVAAA